MKKAYINPTTEVVDVELQQFCATSIGVGKNYDGESDVLSRDNEFDIWSLIESGR